MKGWLWRCCLLLGCGGCGPAIEVGGGDTEEGESQTTTSGNETTVSPGTTGSDVTGTVTTASPTAGPGTVTTETATSDATFDPSDGTGGCGCNFLCEPPGPCDDECGNPIPGCIPPIECDVWSQDCPDGEKCSAWANDGGNAWNAVRCVPLDPTPNIVGSPCLVEGSDVSGIDTCGIEAKCFHVDPETNIGTCVALCGGDESAPSCADLDEACVVANGGVLNLCLQRCDPLAPACPGAQGCYLTSVGFVCADQGTEFDDGELVGCPYLMSCDPGSVCRPASSCPGDEPCCAPLCALGDPMCPDALACLDAVGEAGVGVCGEP